MLTIFCTCAKKKNNKKNNDRVGWCPSNGAWAEYVGAE